MELVVFTKTNARILKNPHPLDMDRIDKKNIILKNPDRSLVTAIPLHYWKPDVEGNKVVPMTSEEMFQRDQDHDVHGVINDVFYPREKPQPEYMKPVIIEKKPSINIYLVIAYMWLFLLTLLYLWMYHV